MFFKGCSPQSMIHGFYVHSQHKICFFLWKRFDFRRKPDQTGDRIMRFKCQDISENSIGLEFIYISVIDFFRLFFFSFFSLLYKISCNDNEYKIGVGNCFF